MRNFLLEVVKRGAGLTSDVALHPYSSAIPLSGWIFQPQLLARSDTLTSSSSQGEIDGRDRSQFGPYYHASTRAAAISEEGRSLEVDGKQHLSDSLNAKHPLLNEINSRIEKASQIDHHFRSDSERTQVMAISESIEPPKVGGKALSAYNEAVSADRQLLASSAIAISQSSNSSTEINVLRPERGGTILGRGETQEQANAALSFQHESGSVKKSMALKPAENSEKAIFPGQSIPSGSFLQAPSIPSSPSPIEPTEYIAPTKKVNGGRETNKKAETEVSKMEPMAQDRHKPTAEVDRLQSEEKVPTQLHKAVPVIVERMHLAEIAKRGVIQEANEKEAQEDIRPIPISRRELLLERPLPIRPPPAPDAKEVRRASAQSSSCPQVQRIVQVHIGTIEMRGVARSPLPAKPPSRLSAILGFDEYEMVRNYMS